MASTDPATKPWNSDTQRLRDFNGIVRERRDDTSLRNPPVLSNEPRYRETCLRDSVPYANELSLDRGVSTGRSSVIKLSLCIYSIGRRN